MYIAKTDSWYLERITILTGGIATIVSIILRGTKRVSCINVNLWGPVRSLME